MADMQLIEDEIETNGVPAVVANGQTMMQVRGSYATAVSVQKPRDLNAVQKRLKQEAELAGESFYYGWGSGKEKIDGASIGLAMAAARCWGNCVVEQLPMQETRDAWIFTTTFVDLETGFTVARQFRQSKKSQVHGKHDAERKDDMRFQIGQSKAARNVILKAIPEWLIDQAKDAAKSGVRTKIEKYVADKGMAAAVDMVVKGLGKCGVSEAAILDKCGVAALGGIDIDHLVILRGDLSALQNGQDRVDALFPSLAEQAPESGKRARKSDVQLPDHPEPSGVPTSTVGDLATIAEKLGCPEDECLEYAERALKTEDPEGFLLTKPWPKGAKTQKQLS